MRGRVALPFFALSLVLGVVSYGRARVPPYARDRASVGAAPSGVLPIVPMRPSEPATETGARVIERLRTIAARTRVGRYEHVTHVDEARGEYRWDCSGMAAWILQREAPAVLAAVAAARPRARDLARAIAGAPATRYRHGLRRIDHVLDVRPGDLFAWERPAGAPGTETGHVGFVLSGPVPTLGLSPAVTIRVADSTTVPHQSDTRAHSLDEDGGLGEGTMAFLVDADGHVTAYGWGGTLSPLYVVTPVRFGRLE